MDNPWTIILVVALLWVSVVAATRTKLQSIENVDGGICKSMLETQGYTCQEHKVTTEDGYILGLQRIPMGRSGDETPNKKPVLLQHGLLVDASAWQLNPPDQALAFILADNGFDVWLANTRGTNSSRGHTSLTPNDPAYWDWSWDELAAYDLPALFKYVNNQTGQNLHYVGHSLGTLTALAAFSQEKLLNLLRSAALLSPIAYLGQMSSLFIRIFVDLFLAEKQKLLGLHEVPNSETKELVDFICNTLGVDCTDLFETITGPNCCLSSASKAALFKNFPRSTATKNIIHLSQINPTSMNFSSIEPLSGGNYKKWRQDVEIILGLMDYDLALREDEPQALDHNSTVEQRLKFEKWEKANRMALLVIKRSISEAVRGGIPTTDKAKDFLEAIEAKFKVSEKGEMGNLMTTLTTLKYDGKGTVREHILKLVEAAAKLTDLEVPIDDAFVVHMALNSLPDAYEQLKTSYNTQKEKWSLNDLISICVQEESRIKRVSNEAVNFIKAETTRKTVSTSGKPYKPFSYSHAAGNDTPSSSKGSHGFKGNIENIKCYFCKEFGHLKRDCDKRKKWAPKKGVHKKGNFKK